MFKKLGVMRWIAVNLYADNVVVYSNQTFLLFFLLIT